MAKYSYEFKKKVVLEYLAGHGSYCALAQKHAMPDKTSLRSWVIAYTKFGDEGLGRSRNQKIYSFEKKLSIVESYLTSEISYQDLATRTGIIHPAMIARWVKEFKSGGPDALRDHKKGRKKTLNEFKDSKPVQDIEETNVDTSAEHVLELENELLKLRIENAFLKELRRLRLEAEAKMRDAHGSSSVSEDSSS